MVQSNVATQGTPIRNLTFDRAICRQPQEAVRCDTASSAPRKFPLADALRLLVNNRTTTASCGVTPPNLDAGYPRPEGPVSVSLRAHTPARPRRRGCKSATGCCGCCGRAIAGGDGLRRALHGLGHGGGQRGGRLGCGHGLGGRGLHGLGARAPRGRSARQGNQAASPTARTTGCGCGRATRAASSPAGAFNSGTPEAPAREPIKLTPNSDLLTGLTFNDGVRDLPIKPVGSDDVIGLGGPEYKLLRVRPRPGCGASP